MANDLNQCNFIGRLGQDVDSRTTGDGTAVANLSLAVNWKTKTKEGTEWIRIVAFGKLAEIMAQYLAKGSRIFVSGSMRTRKWQDQQGIDRYTTEIVASEMQMLDSRAEPAGGSGQSRASANPAGGQGAGMPPNEYAQATGAQQPPAFDDFDDDIPW